MAFGTPWAVGGGASHQVEVARQQTFDSTGGAEGVSRPDSLRVRPLATPGTSVRVAPGGALLLNRYPGGQGQSYSVRNDVEVEVPVTATGSSGGRSDLVVARVLDPQYEGQPPADPDAFDYSMVEIIEGVSPNTLSVRDLSLAYPATALARIDLPSSTGTVQAQHLTDLREVAQPRKRRHLITYNLYQRDGDWRLVNKTADGQSWPNINWDEWQVDVPEWATHAQVIGSWNSIIVPQGSTGMWGNLWVRLGWNPDQQNHIGHRDTQIGTWDLDDADGLGTVSSREFWAVADDVTVPAAIRGTRQPLRLRARRNDELANTNAPKINYVSSVSIDIEFSEGPA